MEPFGLLRAVDRVIKRIYIHLLQLEHGLGSNSKKAYSSYTVD